MGLPMNRSRLLRCMLLPVMVCVVVVLGILDRWGDRIAFESTPSIYAAPTPKEETPPAGKSDWVMHGGTPQRNMVNHIDKNLKIPFDLKKDLKWKVDVGTRANATPIVSGRRIFLGTNNDLPRNKRDIGATEWDEAAPRDKGIFLCLNEKDGEFLWQGVHDKLEKGIAVDWPKEGITSTPTIDGKRVYYMSNRCELICADFFGFEHGNQGDQTEQYQTKTDADILWKLDLIKEYKVNPHNATPCSPLIVDDLLLIVTSNGVGEEHTKVASPDAPSFMAVNKHTGKVIWTSNLPGKNIMHGQWSSPAYGVINKRPQVIFPGGDGWLYSFDPPTGKLLWKFDVNPKDSVYELGGKGTRNDFIGMPVIYKDRVYIGTGQDPEHFDGLAYFHCIDPSKDGDISAELVTDEKATPPKTKPNPNSGVVWRFGAKEEREFARRDHTFGRTISTACIVDDIIYISEMAGYVHCLDAKTGKEFWSYDVKAALWGSAYFVDGKVILANEDGDLFIFKHDPKPERIDTADAEAKAGLQAQKEALDSGLDQKAATKKGDIAARTKSKEMNQLIEKKYLLAKLELGEPVRNTVTVANGVLYVQTQKTLYALRVAKD